MEKLQTFKLDPYIEGLQESEMCLLVMQEDDIRIELPFPLREALLIDSSKEVSFYDKATDFGRINRDDLISSLECIVDEHAWYSEMWERSENEDEYERELEDDENSNKPFHYGIGGACFEFGSAWELVGQYTNEGLEVEKCEIFRVYSDWSGTLYFCPKLKECYYREEVVSFDIAYLSVFIQSHGFYYQEKTDYTQNALKCVAEKFKQAGVNFDFPCDEITDDNIAFHYNWLELRTRFVTFFDEPYKFCIYDTKTKRFLSYNSCTLEYLDKYHLGGKLLS